MIKLCRDDLFSNLVFLQGCRVFCFGGGKIFRAVLPELGELKIEGVIDNFLSKDTKEITVDGRDFGVISFDRYIQIAESDDVILITSLYYREILQQLDEEKSLEGIKCYLASKPSEYELDELARSREISNEKMAVTVSESDGNHFQIWEYIADNMHAGSKAPRDVRDILASRGYEPINIHVELCTGNEPDRTFDWRRDRTKEEWQSCVEKIPASSVLVLQNPFRAENIHREKAMLELKEKGVKLVSIVHDIESIRGLNSSGYFIREEEFMMRTADVIVVQNAKMRGYLETRWPEKKQIVELGIFDYLADGAGPEEKIYDRTVSFAGSLEYRKSPFLYKLGELADTRFALYGPDFEQDRFDGGVIPENLEYKGAHPPEVMPEKLNKGFGLVWEGEGLDTCDKGTGHYLTMNTPHKLSLYLASGLPVIIWDEAAMAEFVLENDVGFVVSSLYQLEEKLGEVTEEDYFRYASNARKIGQRLRNGEYTKAAIKEAERRIKKNTSPLQDRC